MLPTISFASDIHAGLEDRSAINCWLESIRLSKPDIIVCGGDWLDDEQLHKGSLNRLQARGLPKHGGLDVVEEIIIVRGLLEYVRSLCPKAKIVYLWGNHEARIPRVVAAQLPQLYAVVPALGELLDLESQRIEIGESLQIAGWYVHHGWRWNIHAGKSAMEDQMGSTLQGHSHRLKTFCRTGASGHRQVFGVEAGCLCRIEAHYQSRPTPDWQQGWATLEPCGPSLRPYSHPIYQGQTRFGGKAIDGRALHGDVWNEIDKRRAAYRLEGL